MPTMAKVMNEIDFKNWFSNQNISKKVISDTISRLKRLELSLDNIDLDEEYKKDNCAQLLSFFKCKGLNSYAKQFVNCNLPVGQYQLTTYKYALNKYIIFLKEHED